MNGNLNIHQPTKGQELYDAVKGGLTLNGSSLSKWCRKNNVLPANARHALLGSWTGPKAQQLLDKLIKDSQATELLNIKGAANG